MKNGTLPTRAPSPKVAFTRARDSVSPPRTSIRATEPARHIVTKAKLHTLQRQQTMPRLEPPGAAQGRSSRIRAYHQVLNQASARTRHGFKTASRPGLVKGKAKSAMQRAAGPVTRTATRPTRAFGTAARTTVRPSRTVSTPVRSASRPAPVRTPPARATHTPTRQSSPVRQQFTRASPPIQRSSGQSR